MIRRHRARPTYQGRPLPRPDEEVVDQGLAFDLGTLVDRRSMLRMFGLGAASVGLAACAAKTSGSGSATSSSAASATSSSSSSSSSNADTTTAAATTEIPEETAGPYPGDGSNGVDVLTESGIVRSDIRSSFGDASATAEGIPMTLELTLTDLVNAVPFEGVAVYVWHCNRDGEYSLYADGLTNENYLRGVQLADADGTVTFTSIFPACYSGRWPHIHFEVYPDQSSITDASNAIATSQVALPQDVCEAAYASDGYSASVTNLARVSLDSDNVFGDDGGVNELATVTGDASSGYRVALAVGIDTSTAAGGGGSAGGGGAGPGGAPPASR